MRWSRRSRTNPGSTPTSNDDDRPVWGMPTACPSCGGAGYLDRIDLVNDTMQQHCVMCATAWETPKRETSAAPVR